MLLGLCLAGIYQALRLGRTVAAWRGGSQADDGTHAGAGMG
jgi:hypothetical protein